MHGCRCVRHRHTLRDLSTTPPAPLAAHARPRPRAHAQTPTTRPSRTFSLKVDGATGALTPLAASDVAPNPAFVLKHPTRPLVYVSTECIMRPEDADGSYGGRPSPAGHGEVLTLALRADGGVREVAPRAHAGRRSTCFLTLVGDTTAGAKSAAAATHLAVVNYWDAVVSLFAVSPRT